LNDLSKIRSIFLNLVDSFPIHKLKQVQGNLKILQLFDQVLDFYLLIEFIYLIGYFIHKSVSNFFDFEKFFCHDM
jgi:hypothetical protein